MAKEEQEKTILQEHDTSLSHDPFVIRRWIVISGVSVGILGAIFEWMSLRGTPQAGPPLNGIPFLELALYFCCVTVGDFVSHFVLKLKPSSFSDENLLLRFQGVTGKELDHYCDTRRNIRISSLLVASLVFGLFVMLGRSNPLSAFCIAYILSTLVGILAVRCSSKTKRPRLIRRDSRYDYPPPWIRPVSSAEPYLMEPSCYRHLRGEIGTLWK